MTSTQTDAQTGTQTDAQTDAQTGAQTDAQTGAQTGAGLELLINDPKLEVAAVRALRSVDGVGAVVASPLRPVHKGFRAFVDHADYEVSEIAIVTLLQAIAFDKDVVFLPLTALGRHQHQTLISIEDLEVADLPGRTVGVRAWSQTTGVWLRGVLAEKYGVDLSSVSWRTYSRGHVPEHSEPDFVTSAEDGASLADDLLEGRVDFAIMGNDRPDDPRVRSVIADPKAAATAWGEEVGYIPVNHVIAVRGATARSHSAAICAMYDAIAEDLRARNAAQTGGLPMNPVGFEALRPAITAAARFAGDQGLLPREVSYDEIVTNTCDALGIDTARLGA